jgi:5,10-methenyltetrahydromethanopterin hydrogenase
LCELTRNTAEDRRGDQVFVATGLTANEAVKEAVVEAGEERRGQATASKKGMGGGFS